MKPITLKMLRDLEACQDQVDLFEETFGQSVTLTKAIVNQHAGKFDICWFASQVLKGPALAEYKKVQGPAWAEYKKARDLAFYDAWELM